MTTSQWNPQQYERFREERQQPFHDLVALIQPQTGMRVADLGCGTGELTRRLHEHLHARETVGIDSSETMLSRGTELAGGGVRFELGEIGRFTASEPFDLLFSNAALHWVDDHPALLRRLTAAVAPGGQLAVQVPANYDHASHVVAAEVAGEEPFRSELRGYARGSSVLAPERYCEVLDQLGYTQPHVRLQVYAHHLASREDVVEWTRGTLLVAYQERLSPESFAHFLQRYRERLIPKLADTRPHLYLFKRILLWARRGS